MAALVVGIVAFLLGLVPVLGLLAGVAAVVLGIVAVRRSTRGVGTAWTFGLIGVIGGGLAVLAGLFTTALLVIGLVGGAGGGTSGTAAPAPPPTQSRPITPSPAPSRSASPRATPSSPGVPEPVAGEPGAAVAAADGVSCTVTNLTCGIATVGERTLVATAQGQYCVVDVTVANGADAPVRFSPTYTSAYADDVQFAPDTEASIYADVRGAYGPINPGQSQPSKIASDVPKDTSLDRIVLTSGYDTVTGEQDPGVSVSLS